MGRYRLVLYLLIGINYDYLYCYNQRNTVSELFVQGLVMPYFYTTLRSNTSADNGQ